VRRYDPSDQGPQPQGKQRIGAITKPGGDHYTPSSGIWQTVWFENVGTSPAPASYVFIQYSSPSPSPSPSPLYRVIFSYLLERVQPRTKIFPLLGV
jgi:hypothetical protein